MIIHTLVVGRIQTNCYIVSCPQTKACAIVDPGENANVILSFVERQSLHPKYLLITHAHFDHIAAVGPVAHVTRAQVALHPGEEPLYKMGGGGMLWGVAVPPLPTPDILLSEGQILEVGTLRLYVLHVPGHTPGHVVFHEPAGKALFAGDVLFAGSIGRADLPGSNPDQLVGHICTKLMALPNETDVYPGHGPTTTIGQERRGNPFLQIKLRQIQESD